MFNYKAALVRGLASTFEDALSTHAPEHPIDMELAHRQHAAYVDQLRQLLPRVIEIPAEDQFPDCCFIEDTAIVVDDLAIINRLGAPSRQGEEVVVATQLKAEGLRITSLEGDALADGGDVLFTGDSVFVGLSARTNSAAYEQIKALVAPLPVYPITVQNGLHLKSFISQADQNCLFVSNCSGGQNIAQQIDAVSSQDFHYVFVPDGVAANCLRIGKHIVMQAGFQKSNQVINAFAQELNLECVALNMSEFIKADGALTCCSILVTR